MTNLTIGILIGGAVVALAWAVTKLYRALSKAMDRDDAKDGGKY